MPLGVKGFSLGGLHFWFEFSVYLPFFGYVSLGFPEACGEACEVGGAEGCGFLNSGALGADSEDIGLELHECVVGCCAAVYAKLFEFSFCVGFHGVDEVTGLVGHGLQGCVGDVAAGGAAFEADDGAACVGVPMGGAEPNECGDEVYAAVVFFSGGKFFDVLGAFDDFESVAEPLDGCAADEYGALKAVGDFPVDAPADGGEKAVLAGDGLGSGVHEDEAACAVGIFYHAGIEAGLPECSGLLVAGDARDRDGRAEEFGICFAEESAGVFHFREHRAGDVEDFEELVVPVEFVDVEDEGAGGVRVVGGVDFSAGESPEEVGVDGSRENFAFLGAFTEAFVFVEEVLNFGAGEVGIDDESCFFDECFFVSGFLELFADGRCDAGLPDDGVMDGFACFFVPEYDCFALVGDADCSDIVG